MSYVGVSFLILSLVAIGYQPPKQVDEPVATVAETPESDSAIKPTVDEIVANTVTGSIAERANMPIASSVAQRSISLSVESDLAQTDEEVITKPQIIQPGTSDRDIETYVAKSGDTVQDVSRKYDVSVRTIRWANDLTSDALDAGKKLRIPPVDGVIYKVKADDSVASIAEKYSVDKKRLIAYNDLEITGPTKGDTIILPGGVLPETERPSYQSPQEAQASSYGNYGGGAGDYTSSASRSRLMATAGNRYAPGYCTWYVYERRAAMGRPIGSFWGNAVAWAGSARGAGFTVNNTPAPGAVFQRGGGLGHVGIIDSVNTKAGTVTYSDMNGIAGFGRVGTNTISIADAQARWQFIH